MSSCVCYCLDTRLQCDHTFCRICIVSALFRVFLLWVDVLSGLTAVRPLSETVLRPARHLTILEMFLLSLAVFANAVSCVEDRKSCLPGLFHLVCPEYRTITPAHFLRKHLQEPLCLCMLHSEKLLVYLVLRFFDATRIAERLHCVVPRFDGCFYLSSPSRGHAVEEHRQPLHRIFVTHICAIFIDSYRVYKRFDV